MILTSLSQATRRRIAFLGAIGAFMPCVYAQTAPAAPAKPVTDADGKVIMTPFQVSTDKDVGYQAGNTLSGGRADTPLAITAASISVMTKEFLEDFNITDINQAAMWTVNMEAPRGGDGGNGGPFGGNQFQANFRGAGGGGNYPARNGSLQYVAADSYNSERFEFARGPNAALFGDAGAGGVQGSNSKQARYNTKSTEVIFRGDSFGGYRATLDTIYGLERFGIRVNLLNQSIRPTVDYIHNKENAVSIATSIKLATNTQFRAEFERSAEKNQQYRKTYGEQASLWDRSTVNNDNTPIVNPGLYGLQVISATNDALIFNSSTGSLLNYVGNQYRTIGLGYQIPWKGNPYVPNFKSGIDKHFNLAPPDSNFQRDIQNIGVYLEQRFGPDVFAQIAFTRSDVDPVNQNFQGVPSEYRIDVNRLLPTGGPNPNFLKPYADFGQNSQYQQNGVTEAKFNVSYKFEVPRFWDLKQRFVLNGGHRKDLYEAWNRELRRTDNPVVTSVQDSRNDVTFRVYWDQPRPKLAPVLTAMQKGTYNGIQFANVDTGFQALNDVRLDYAQIVSQSTWLNDHVSLTASIRRDKNTDDKMGNINAAAQLTPPYHVPVGNNGVVGLHTKLVTYKTSKSAGIVVYPFPTSWKWATPIGFVANYSENFSVPPTGAATLSGIAPEPPYAKTKDIGLRYSLPNGVAYATLTHYNTTRLNNLVGGGSTGDFSTIYTNLGYTNSALTSFPAYRDFQDNKLEGWEAELTVNPTRNITMTMNYAHPIVYTLRDSPDRRAYIAAHRAEWDAGAAAATGTVINGRTVLDPLAIQTALQNIDNSLNGFTPGTLANGLERHRVNVAGSYRFQDGPLKGFGINSGVVYRGYRKNGSRDAIIKYNLNRAPTTQENAIAAYDYLWVPPTYQVVAGANYTRRFGKYQVRFQLNIDNVLNDTTPQWGSTNSNTAAYSVINAGQLNGFSTGNVNTVAGGNPRMQVLSAFDQYDPRKYTFTTTLRF